MKAPVNEKNGQKRGGLFNELKNYLKKSIRLNKYHPK
jgi:hypothetical protein